MLSYVEHLRPVGQKLWLCKPDSLSLGTMFKQQVGEQGISTWSGDHKQTYS